MPYPYQEYTVEERRSIVTKIRSKYPNVIPVLIDIPGRNVLRRKYLVPETTTLSRLLYSIRQENKLNEYEGVFLFANNTLLTMSQCILETYARHASRDGFLYVIVTFENTFGGRNTLNPNYLL